MNLGDVIELAPASQEWVANTDTMGIGMHLFVFVGDLPNAALCVCGEA